MNMKPRFKTNGKLTHFLGQFGRYDLYFDSGCCLARYGDEESEYLASPPDMIAQTLCRGGYYPQTIHESPTLACFYRAKDFGIIEVSVTVKK